MIPEIYLIVSWVIVAITHLSVAIAVIFGVVLPLIVYMFRTIRRLFARPGMNNTLKNLIDDQIRSPSIYSMMVAMENSYGLLRIGPL